MPTTSIYTDIETIVSPAPLRDVISSPTQVTGYVTTRCSGPIGYESPLERDLLERLDFNPQVKLIRAQSIRFKFRDEHNARRRYTPDFYVEYHPKPCGTAWWPRVYEVKPYDILRRELVELRPGLIVAAMVCQQKNWRFRIATEKTIRTPFLANVSFLRGFLIKEDVNGQRHAILKRLRHVKNTTASKLLADVFPDEDENLMAIGVLWHLVATRAVGASLNDPLNMASRIYQVNHGK